MLSLTLNTNEVKNAAGTGVNFRHLRYGEGREHIYHEVDESPALEHRLTIKHSDTGKGVLQRRRSMYRFDKSVVSTVDTSRIVTASSIHILDLPVGAMLVQTEFANVCAEGMSFLASLGASTTILYNCTGNGAAILLSGEH